MDSSYNRYRQYQANRRQYKMDQIAAPIVMMLILGFVTEYWVIIVTVTIAVLVLKFKKNSKKKKSTEVKQNFYTLDQIMETKEKMQIPNETEAERLTGEKDAFRNAELFLEHGANCVIIKRGAKGCLIKTLEQEITVPAYSKAKAVDTTGAGDSFVAGFIRGLKNGMPLEECARFGGAVASCTVETVGANAAVKSPELPMQRYEEMLADVKSENTR